LLDHDVGAAITTNVMAASAAIHVPVNIVVRCRSSRLMHR